MENKTILDRLTRKDELLKISEVFFNNGTFNLKMYDVSMYCYQENISHDVFNTWCSDEYGILKDYIDGLDSDIEFDFLGRSSSFYIEFDNDLKCSDLNGHYWDSFYHRLCNYFEDLDEYYHYGLEDLNTDVDELIKGMLDVQKVVDYINSFTENQLENFKEYITKMTILNGDN